MAGLEARKESRTYVVSVLFAVMGMIVLSAQSQVAPDSSALLNELMKQQGCLPPYALQTETQMSWQSPKGKGAEVSVYQVRWDGTRVDAIMSEYGVDGETRVARGSKRAIWDGQQYLIRLKLNTRSGEETPLQAAFSSDKAHAQRLIASSYNGGFLAGYLDAGVHICERLKKASSVSVRSDMENVKGNPCYVLTAEAEGKHYTLWIDPDKGFNIRQAVIERIDPVTGPVTVRLDDVEVRKVNDLWVPVSGTRATTTMSGHQTFTSRRTHIAFNPDFEGMQAFRMDQIPNGTSVINLDFPSLSYVWKDGKIVTDVTDEYLGALDESIVETQALLKEESTSSHGLSSEPVPARPNSPVPQSMNQTDKTAVGPARVAHSAVLIGVGLAGMAALLGLYVYRRLSPRTTKA